MVQLTLAHLSDPHLAQPKWGIRILASPKRSLAFAAWKMKKQRRHNLRLLHQAFADISELSPNAILMTGDFTQAGTPHECEQVRDWLAGLPHPERISLVPGNHDRTTEEPLESTLDLWRPWIGESAQSDDYFPTYRVLENKVALIGLSSACATAPLFSSGRIGSKQRARLADLLQKAEKQRLFRVLFLHHPPHPRTVSRRKRLMDSIQLQELIEQWGTELILHGHAHRPALHWVGSKGRGAPAIGAPSVTDLRQPGPAWNSYDLREVQDGWQMNMTVHRWTPEAQRFLPGPSECIEVPKQVRRISPHHEITTASD